MAKNSSTNIDRSWGKQLKAAERQVHSPLPKNNLPVGGRPKDVYFRHRNSRDPLRLIGIGAVVIISSIGLTFVGKKIWSAVNEDSNCKALEGAVASLPANTPRYINVQSSIQFPSKDDASVGVESVFEYRIHTDAEAVATEQGCGLSVEVEAVVDPDNFSKTALDGSAVTPLNFTVDYVFDAMNSSESSSNLQACNNELSILSGTVNMNLATFVGGEAERVDSVEFVGSLGSVLQCGANNG